MDRIKRAQLGRLKLTGGREDAVADPDQLEPAKHLGAAPHRLPAKRKQRSRHLCSRECT